MNYSDKQTVADFEPILQNNPNRFVLFPIVHDDIWAAYKSQQAAIWAAEELDLSQDIKDWEQLNDNERHFIKHILAFFAASDGIVNENLAENFLNEVQYTEAKFFYGLQVAMENVHSETYSLLIDTYIKDDIDKAKLFDAIHTIPAIEKKAEWALKWIEHPSFAVRLIAFAVVEGIFFSGAFCSIFWLKSRGLMPGLTFSNELISRDEGMHYEFAALLYNSHVVNKVDSDIIYSIVKEAVDIETEFITEALPVSLIGMNDALMTEYVQFVANRLCTMFNVGHMYQATNPFAFMDMISVEGKTNFFEKRVGEYKKAGFGSDNNDKTFSLDEDF